VLSLLSVLSRVVVYSVRLAERDECVESVECGDRAEFSSVLGSGALFCWVLRVC